MNANLMTQKPGNRNVRIGLIKASAGIQAKRSNSKLIDRQTPDPRNALTNGDPPDLMLWGSEE